MQNTFLKNRKTLRNRFNLLKNEEKKIDISRLILLKESFDIVQFKEAEKLLDLSYKYNLHHTVKRYFDFILMLKIKQIKFGSLMKYFKDSSPVSTESLVSSGNLIFELALFSNLLKINSSNIFFIKLHKNLQLFINNSLFFTKNYRSYRDILNKNEIRKVIDEVFDEHRVGNKLIDKEALYALFLKWQRQLGFFAFSEYAKRLGLLEEVNVDDNKVMVKTAISDLNDIKKKMILNLEVLEKILNNPKVRLANNVISIFMCPHKNTFEKKSKFVDLSEYEYTEIFELDKSFLL